MLYFATPDLPLGPRVSRNDKNLLSMRYCVKMLPSVSNISKNVKILILLNRNGSERNNL